MSQRKPKGLLSFIRNTTGVAAFRDEMHVDMRVAFERFGVVDGSVQGVCFDVERAAYEIRKSSQDRFGKRSAPLAAARHAAARQLMIDSSRALFRELARDLTARLLAGEDLNGGLSLAREICKDPPADGVRGEGPIELRGDAITVLEARELGEAPLLLDILYYYFHFPETRGPLRQSRALARALEAIAQKSGSERLHAEVVEGLAELDRFMTTKGSPSRIAPLVARLGELLAIEYDDRASCYCW